MSGKEGKKKNKPGRFPHLVAPQPLEGQTDLEQNGDDPREVNVANDLRRESQGLVRFAERFSPTSRRDEGTGTLSP